MFLYGIFIFIYLYLYPYVFENTFFGNDLLVLCAGMLFLLEKLGKT